jgi:hypothetical protein
MLPNMLVNVSCRLVLIWILVSGIGLLCGQKLLKLLLPVFSVVITLAQDDFWPTLDIAETNGEMVVRMSAKIIRSIPLSANQSILSGASVNYTAIGVLHAVVPAVLFITLILAWPIHSWREGMHRCVLSVPSFILMMLMTAPLFLVGRFQMAIVDMAQRLGQETDDTLLILWTIFLEMGGNWLLPILLAVFCIFAAQKGLSPKRTAQKITHIQP